MDTTEKTPAENQAAEPPVEHWSYPRNASPRFALWLFDCSTIESAWEFIEKIPEAADAWLEEVTVFFQGTLPTYRSSIDRILDSRRPKFRFRYCPRELGPGASRKEAIAHVLANRFDYLVVMCANDHHDPEKLSEYISKALDVPDGLLLITRSITEPLYRIPTHILSTFIQNRLSGLRLSDYQTRCRIYPSEALSRIPFQLNSNDALFDAEIILQFRTLGRPIVEAPLLTTPSSGKNRNHSFGYAARTWATAIDLRLHQLHVTRDGRFLVHQDIHYTLKLSKTSSHMQIVSAIKPNSKVLDLGCSQGLLAKPLSKKNVAVTGVDSGLSQRLAPELFAYHRRDLEHNLDLPCSREFDYIVCADVIEHLRNRVQLLRNMHRYLKKDGLLIISTPNIALWFYRLSLLFGRFEYGPRGTLDETHVHLFTGATFRREVEKAGFRVVHQHVTSLPFEIVFQSTGRSRLIRGLSAAYHFLARLWPSMFAYQYVLEAQSLIQHDVDPPSDARPDRR